MSKADLIAAVKNDTHLTVAQATAAVESVLLNIPDLAAKGSLQLRGFGTFSMFNRKAREGLNPKTQEKVQVSEKTVLKFKVSKK